MSVLKNARDLGLVLAEERNASKKGLKELKRAGYTEDELETAKRNYKLSEGTYMSKARSLIKSDLHPLVQIPSRRSGPLLKKDSSRFE